MRVSSLLVFVGGACVFISGVTVRLLASYQAFDFLRIQQPALYAWLVSPTIVDGTIFVGVAIMGACCFEIYRHHKGPKDSERQNPYTAEPKTIDQETHGAHSPISTIGSIGDIGAGAQVVVGLPASHIERRQQQTSNKHNPVVVSRGIRSRSCEIPWYDENVARLNEYPIRHTETTCVALAIRNDGSSRDAEADNVVAHLDFVSPGHDPISVDEGWWCEDAEESSTHTFYISNAETKHLVIAMQGGEMCFAVGKKFQRKHGRHMPFEPVPISAGHWYLTIQIKAENISQFFYTEGEISVDGSSKWTEPVTTRPASWDDVLAK